MPLRTRSIVLAIGMTLCLSATPRVPAGAVSSERPCGRWSVVPSPNVSGQDMAEELHDVVAISPVDAWAVGTTFEEYYSAYGVIEHWDGTAWTRLDRGFGGDWLAVDASGPDDVWAVGVAIGSDGGIPTSAHWDGTSWQSVSVGAPEGFLIDVKVFGPNNVVAVGGVDTSDGRASMLRWNGRRWAPIAALSSYGNSTAVDARSPRDLWALVGREHYGAESVIHRDGSTWTVTPTVRSDRSSYFDIAVAPSTAWLVGQRDPDTLGARAVSLTQRWDGEAWSYVPAALRNSILSGVFAPTDAEAWAVGERRPARTALIEHWSPGDGWTVVPTSVDDVFGLLQGIDGTGASDVWAVGQTYVDGDTVPLIEHWC